MVVSQGRWHKHAIDDPDFLRVLVERTVQAILEAEMTAHLGAARYERGDGRTGYRNGTKPRTLVTRVGTLSCGAPGSGRHVLDGTLRALPAQRTSAHQHALGDVCPMTLRSPSSNALQWFVSMRYTRRSHRMFMNSLSRSLKPCRTPRLFHHLQEFFEVIPYPCSSKFQQTGRWRMRGSVVTRRVRISVMSQRLK